MKTIIYYQNRKLYSKETHQYVVLSDIHQYIKNKEPFRVVTMSGDDVTSKIMFSVLDKFKKMNQATIENLVLSHT